MFCIVLFSYICSNKIQQNNIMNYSDLQPRHQDSVVGRILEAKSMLNYHEAEIIPYYRKMEAWELKEYKANHEQYLKEFEELKSYILNTESIGGLLAEYGHTAVSFLNQI